MGYIYGHKCIITNKWYIGQTIKKRPEYRWGKDGKSYLVKNPNSHFANAIKKYGWDNFEHYIFEENVPEDKLDQLEKEYIEKYNSVENGYNNTYGGGANHKVSDLTKQKLSHCSKEMWQKNGDKMRNIYSSEEHRKKLSEGISNTYKVHPELREKASKIAKNLIWICNADESIRINKNDFTKYQKAGYQRGKVYISNVIGKNIINDYTEKDLSIGDIMDKYSIKSRITIERYLISHNIQLINKHYLVSQKTKGRPKTEDFKQKVSKSTKKHRKGKVWINNGTISKSILETELEEYLNNGWKRGRGKIKTDNMKHNELKKKIICVETRQIYLGINATAKILGVPKNTLKAALKHPNRTINNKHYKYVD